MIKISFQTIKFAFKNAFRKKLIAGLSITGIAIGIALMVALSSASAGFDGLLEDTLAETIGDVRVTEYGKQLTLSQLPKNITDTIMSIEDSDKIEAISPEVYVFGFDQYSENITLTESSVGPGMNFVSVSATGINESYDKEFNGATTKLIDGRIFQNDLEIIVADFIAKGSNGLFSIDEKINFKVNFTYSIELTTVGIFDTEEDPLATMSTSIFMSTESALMLNNFYLPYEQTGYNYVNIRFDSSSLNETKDYSLQLEELEPKLDVVVTGDYLASADELLENFSMMQTILYVIVIVAGGMAILVAQLMGVNERMKEFAIMKATGWKNRTILLDIILESIIVGVLGSLVGFGLGAGLLFVVQLGATEAFMVITWQLILQVLGFGLGLGVIAGLIPGIRAASVKPMEVIRSL